MAKTVLEAKRSEMFGAISRKRNTSRLFVAGGNFVPAAVTGTWAAENASGVVTLATDDAGTTNVFQVPFPVVFSDHAVEGGQAATDRGIRVIGCEVIYQVAASALASFDLDIYRVNLDVEGDPTAAEIVTTLGFDTGGDTGVEIDDHRATATIAERDRFFMDSGSIVYALAEFEDGTASDVNIFGAIWHFETYEE